MGWTWRLIERIKARVVVVSRAGVVRLFDLHVRRVTTVCRLNDDTARTAVIT